ncbi:MAG TPA: aminotransferase class I/II-fold pyridoxal phosphate-dependent enzyme [Candidatus Eisenbacteria bacterium]|nr:aminotransferase class I/II-fold pyridoxal phosphate-dependent enzyme [Candidatus Eisenbacteria bacterium]
MTLRSQMSSPYMEWAKLNSSAKYNLATSGIMSYPLAELPVLVEDLEINGPDSYGYKPLLERIARYNNVSPDCVVTAAGTSLANHLAMAGTFDPGDEVLVEHPTYELLETTALYLGAKLRRFERRFADGFRIDLAEVERNITPTMKLIALTNLHNPSGAYADEATLRAVGELAKAHGALVLVDEVYLETFYEDRPPTALQLGDQFLVTSSLTKAFGLSGVRCGWVLANPDLCHRMRRIHDLYGVNPAHPADLISVIAFDNLDKVAARAQEILQTNRPELDTFLDARRDLDFVRPDHGTVVFPRLRHGNLEDFAELLREKYETSIVPGRFFDMPQHFRIGIGGDPEMTREGLHRLALALDEYAARA